MFENVRLEVWLAVVTAFVVYFAVGLLRRLKSKYPPGPWGVPVLGYIPFLKENVHIHFMELAAKYGEVFSLQLGTENVVILNGSASVREAFGKAAFLGRPPFSAFSLMGSQSPFFLNDLKVWKEQRRFVVQSMKDLGLGRSKIEESIQDEISHFRDVLASRDGKPMDLKGPLTPSISNNICALVFGKRYEYGEPDRIFLDEAIERVSGILAQTSSHIFFPWIRHFPRLLKWLHYDEGVLAYRRMDNFFMSKVEEHKKSLDPKNIRDFIDSFLVELAAKEANDSNTNFNEEMLLGNMSDIFGAGTEPVRTTVSWCVYTAAAYPAVQERVRQEILEVLGPDRSPEFLDQKQMPFTHAVLLEVMRWKTTLPLNLLRYTTEDTTVLGYEIPRGTTVMANFWAVHHDPSHWSDPDDFRPERFLTPDAKSVAKSKHFMPFAIGKRACPGETMANMSVFLYFVSILQKFEVRLPEGVQPTFDAELTITYRPKPYKVCLIPLRN